MKMTFPIQKLTKMKISDFLKNHFFQILLDHFFCRYLFSECRNVTGKPGNRVFSESRYGFKKIPSKNINFSKSYRFLEKGIFFCKKRAWDFFTSRGHSHFKPPRGLIEPSEAGPLGEISIINTGGVQVM